MRGGRGTRAAGRGLLLATLLFTMRPARAASNAEATVSPELLVFDDPSVSAAAKHQQPSSEAPSAVTVITREEIARYGYRTLADALRGVRGFYTSYDRNYASVGVRGFLRPGDYNDRILLLVNGHTYNDDVFQTAHVGSDFGIDLEAVDHIEVIRGPGSTLYGGNALFAVINVVTLTAAQAPGVRPLAETGSFGRKRGQVSVGHAFDNGVEVYSSGSALDVDGPENLYYPEYGAARTNHGIAHDVDGERALNYFLSARRGDFSFQGGINRRDKQIPTGAYGTTFNDPDTKTSDGRQFAELVYDAAILPRLDVAARAFYDGGYYRGTYIFGRGRTRVRNIDTAVSQWFGGELRGRWHLFPGNSLTTGAEFTYHPDAAQKNFDRPSGTGYLDDHRTFDTWGFYAEDEWALRPDLTLVGGLRFDSYYGRVRELSPRGAAIWSPRPDTTVKLLVGRAFRAPNLYEQFYGAAVGLGQLPNPALGSERILTYEAVLERRFRRGIRGIVALYRYDIEGLIDQKTISTGRGERTLQYRNLGSITASGVEVEGRVPLPYGVFLRVSSALQKARSDEGVLSNSPSFLASAGLLFPLPAHVDGAVDVVVMGPRRTLGGRTLDPVSVVNLNLVSPRIRRFTFAAGLYNIFDQRYTDPGGAEHRQDAIPQDGLTFRLSLAYAF